MPGEIFWAPWNKGRAFGVHRMQAPFFLNLLKAPPMKNPNRVTSILTSALFATTALLAGCASAQDKAADVMVNQGILTGANGMTLYTFDKDEANSGKSACNGPCATNWPPLMASEAKTMGAYSTITRDDGKLQVAYKGKPLYFWIKDMKAGDTTGDGVNKVWHTATP